MKSTIIAVLFLLIQHAEFCRSKTVPVRAEQLSRGIPGTTQTVSGYDTEFGNDPICWVSQSDDVWSSNTDRNTSHQGQEEIHPFPNELVADYKVAGRIRLLRTCPVGINLTVHAPLMIQQTWFRPRTHETYRYTLTGTMDVRNLRGQRVLADRGDGWVVFQVVVCNLVSSGFCSPFVHEQSNARQVANGDFTKTLPGYVHGGTHIHSPYVYLKIPMEEGLVDFNVTVPLTSFVPGQFFVIGTMQFFVTNQSTGNSTTVPLARYDVANAATPRVLTFQAPPQILRVTLGVEVFVYILSAVASCIILFLLYQVWQHRNNQIMKLSQGKFLLVLLVAALVTAASINFINPKNDVYCTVYPPLLYLSSSIIYAVIIARVWRAQTLLSPLLYEFYDNKWTMAFTNLISRLTSCRRHKSQQLRQSVTDMQLMTVVALFSLPGILIQIVAAIVQPRRIEINFNEEESIGSVRCSSGKQVGVFSLLNWAFFLVMGLNIVLVMVAQASRKLPSLFNEVHGIVMMSSYNITIVAIGYAVIRVANGPSTSPSVEFIIRTAVMLSIALNSSVRLVWPKLKMIWRGETVLVSKLVADHREQLRQNEQQDQGCGSTLHNVTGFRPNGSAQVGHKSKASSSLHNSGGTDRTNGRVLVETPITTVVEDDEEGGCAPLENNTKATFEDPKSQQQRFHDDSVPPAPPLGRRPGMPDSPLIGRDSHYEEQKHSQSSNHLSVSEQAQTPASPPEVNSSLIVVSDDTAPSRSLIVPMLELHERLGAINKRITSGRSVSHEDWEDVRELTRRLGTKFTNGVAFQWEQDAAS